MNKTILILLLTALCSTAKTSDYESFDDKMIYHYSAQYAYYLVNNEPANEQLYDLLSFMDFMDPKAQRGLKLREALKNKQSLTIKGRDTVRLLASRLKKRAEGLAKNPEGQKLACVYLIMADKFVNLTQSQENFLLEAQKSQIKLDLETLYTQVQVPKK